MSRRNLLQRLGDWLAAPVISDAAPRDDLPPDAVPSSDRVRMGEIFGPALTASGASVTPASAMRVAAVYACVRLIAGVIATLPLPVYRKTNDGRERDDKHPLWWLLNWEPTPRYSASLFWQRVVAQFLLRGDAFVWIMRDQNGRARELYPLKSEDVIVRAKDRRLQYFFRDEDGKARGLDQDDVLHFPCFGFDGTRGMSVISFAAREAIGIALRADQFAGQFYGNGVHPQFALQSPGTMTADQIEVLRNQFEERYSGKGFSSRPLVLTEAMDVKELSMSAKDAQLLEARQFQIIDIARAFGVPPHMIGETSASTSWGTGIEQMTIGFVKFAIQPHLTTIENELNRKLLRVGSPYVEFLIEGLLRGDSKARAEYFKTALGGTQAPGWMKPNEVRRADNLPRDADPESDKLYRPKAGTPAATERENTDEEPPATTVA